MVQKEIYDISPTWAGIFEEGKISNEENKLLTFPDCCFLGEAHCGNDYDFCKECYDFSFTILECYNGVRNEKTGQQIYCKVDEEKYEVWLKEFVKHWNTKHKNLEKCVE